jgi:mRNA interferase RelE/StbE
MSDVWHIEISAFFIKSIKRIPSHEQKRINDLIEEYCDGIQDPLRLPHMRKLEGFQNYYRMRLGGYRVGIELDTSRHAVIFRFVGSRGDFYKRFP